jgi:hypothetical protein
VALNWSQYDTSKFFNGKSLTKPLTLTIVSVADEVVGFGADAEHKAVVRVKEDPRGVVLNRSRAEALRELFGDNTDDWAGERFQLVPSRTLFQGKQTPCLLIEAAAA